MLQSLRCSVPIEDEDSYVERLEACGLLKYQWPIPAKNLLGKKELDRRRTSNKVKVLRMSRYLFPRFRELPYELRWKIWDMSELVVPTSARITSSIADNNGHVRAFVKVSTLHASRETRQEMLKHYQLCFDEICDGKPVYINFEIDRLYMYTADTFRRFIVRNPIANIAIHIESKRLPDETRYLLINRSSPSLPNPSQKVDSKN
jgi:hypothetical protein